MPYGPSRVSFPSMEESRWAGCGGLYLWRGSSRAALGVVTDLGIGWGALVLHPGQRVSAEQICAASTTRTAPEGRGAVAAVLAPSRHVGRRSGHMRPSAYPTTIQAQAMVVLDMLFLKSFPLFFPFTAYTTTRRISHRNSKTVAAQRIQAQAHTPLHVALIIQIPPSAPKEIPVFVENIGVFAYYSDVSELKSSSPKRRESI